ncbi:hypothetical protein V7127_01465 [Bacillus sp. JJ1773]|uniref:hypothetical protein n=1 Tax=Bacillus sp. JJ1773 TaxID=3122965 RepID=UPI002FFE51D6
MGKKRRNIIYVTAVLIILTLFYPSSRGLACDCDIPKTANEALNRAAAVFRGEVLQVKKKKINGKSYDVALISVSEIWKGIDESHVFVTTDWSSSCQYDFEVGKEYLFYPNDHDGILKVINCGRSAEIQYANQDLLELGKGKEPKYTVQLEEELMSSKWFQQSSMLLVLFIIVFAIVYFRKKKIKN